MAFDSIRRHGIVDALDDPIEKCNHSPLAHTLISEAPRRNCSDALGDTVTEITKERQTMLHRILQDAGTVSVAVWTQPLY